MQKDIFLCLESVCIKPTVQYGTVSCSPSDDNGTLVAVGGRCSIQCDVWRTPVNSGQQMECLPSGLWSYQAECVMATTSSFRGSSNGAAIAGGLAAGCFVLMVLLAVVIVIWYHRRRLGISFQWKVTSSSKLFRRVIYSMLLWYSAHCICRWCYT